MRSTGSFAVLALAGLAAVGLAAALTEPMRRIALRYGLTDRPAANKAHSTPTPYLGGLAVVAATLLPALILIRHWNLRIGGLLLAGAAIAVLGLVDDLRSLRPAPKLVVEAFAAAMIVLCGGRLDVFGSSLPDGILTVGWIVVTTNSFNLLDNMDAAAASVAVAATASLGWLAFVSGQGAHALVLLCLTGACVGFLCHNWPPARIFMGDAGSLFIGFVISSAATLMDVPGRGGMAVTALLVTFVAALDTTVVIVSRQASGRSWFLGGTDHVSHRLQRLGLGTPVVAAVLFLGTAASGLLAVLVARHTLPVQASLGTAIAVGAVLAWLLVRVPGYDQTLVREGTYEHAKTSS